MPLPSVVVEKSWQCVVAVVEMIEPVAGSLVGYLGHSFHLVGVVGGSGNAERLVGKWVVQREMVETRAVYELRMFHWIVQEVWVIV